MSRWLKPCPETGRKPPLSTCPASKAPESYGKESVLPKALSRHQLARNSRPLHLPGAVATGLHDPVAKLPVWLYRCSVWSPLSLYSVLGILWIHGLGGGVPGPVWAMVADARGGQQNAVAARVELLREYGPVLPCPTPRISEDHVTGECASCACKAAAGLCGSSTPSTRAERQFCSSAETRPGTIGSTSSTCRSQMPCMTSIWRNCKRRG